MEYLIRICKYIRAYLFNITKIYSVDRNGNKKNLYLIYLLLKIPLISKYFCWMVDKKNYLTKIEISNNTCTRNIVFKELSIIDIVNKIPLLIKDIDDSNEVIMGKANCIIMDVTINNTSIKNLIEHYADRSGKYDHSLINILKLKQYKLLKMDNKVQIIYIRSFKREMREFKLKDIVGLHVSDLYRII